MATAWDISTAVYEEKSKDVGYEDLWPYGIFFKPDGNQMYILGNCHDTVHQYYFTVPWEMDHANYADKSKDVSAQESAPQGFFFSSDGVKMYVIGPTNANVFQYTLSTAWEINTATYEDKLKYVGDEDSTPRGVFFKADGTKFYIAGDAHNTIYQYTLSTAWDVSTASYEDKSKYVGDEDTVPSNGTFKPDGSKMYIMGGNTDTVFQYTLSTAWDVSTATYEDKYKNVSAQETNPHGLCFKPDGAKMYIAGDNGFVYQYNLPVLPPKKVNTIMFGSNF